MAKIEVRVRCIAEWGGPSTRMVVMETIDGKTLFPIITAENEANYLNREWSDDKVRRPIPYDLIEGMMSAFHVSLREVNIYRLFEGVFYTRMLLASETEVTELEARVSDAVILSIRSQCPVYVEEDVLERVGVSSDVLHLSSSPEHDADDSSGNPVAEIPLERLEKMLQEAVESENFELASTLRDRIRALKGNG